MPEVQNRYKGVKWKEWDANVEQERCKKVSGTEE